MRVLAFCDYYSPESCGGSERVAREVYTRLASDYGVEVTVIGAIPRPQRHDHEVLRDLDHGVRSILVPAQDLSARLGVQLLASRRLPHIAADLLKDWVPDVLHANSLHFQSTLVAAVLARRHRLPLVTTAHLAGGEALRPGLRLAAAGWDQTLGRSTIAASAGVVAVSDSVAAHVRTLGLGHRPMTVAYNGVDHDVFHARGRDDVPGAPLRVGFVGRLITNKGPHLFLEGAAHALSGGADVRLTVIGDGPMRSQLEVMALEGPLRGRVEFTGQVNDVAERMRHLDVVVRSSFTEGLPLAVIEAMASGAVVIGSDVPGTLELISHHDTGYVFPVGDVHALGDAIRTLALDRRGLRALQTAAQRRARKFSWTHSTSRHFDALTNAYVTRTPTGADLAMSA
jgi:glycosyltransferase involved in cell wall biosynthesis